ncbi:hypothetical protein SCAR479_09116 [Seiridium cardinale]|uniref:DUF7730 domain-containing protein n=1 Tax=Seiridium cardinale TaxID=138064 RepID=A0ABR2XKA4_9PEZI
MEPNMNWLQIPSRIEELYMPYEESMDPFYIDVPPFDHIPPTSGCPLLEKIPIELRLMVYEILLCSREKIAISPIRRQQATDGFRCDQCGTTHGRPPYPFWRPCVSILQTCKQINLEATPMLYRQNDFLLSGNSSRKASSIHKVLHLPSPPVHPHGDEGPGLSCRLRLSLLGDEQPERMEDNGEGIQEDRLPSLHPRFTAPLTYEGQGGVQHDQEATIGRSNSNEGSVRGLSIQEQPPALSDNRLANAERSNDWSTPEPSQLWEDSIDWNGNKLTRLSEGRCRQQTHHAPHLAVGVWSVPTICYG